VNGVETCKKFSELGPLSDNDDKTKEVVLLRKNTAIAGTSSINEMETLYQTKF
jgi:hypothetical protein